MNTNLWTLRAKSFFISVGGLFITAGAGVLLSDQFSALLQEYTGTAIWGTLVTLLVTEGLKHMKNKVALGRARKLYGSTNGVYVELI